VPIDLLFEREHLAIAELRAWRRIESRHRSSVLAAVRAVSRANDVNSGVIGAAQCETWKANFGTISPSGGGSLAHETVPEPPCAVLLLAAWLASNFDRRKLATLIAG
jgi:hypothetical protein